jgi:starch-binding outer membrane protein, SusD/RagB family
MKKILYILLPILLLGSCENEFLSPEQVNLTYNEVFWANQQDAEKAVLGLYSLYRGIMLNSHWYDRGDATTGFFHKGWTGGSSDRLYLPGDFANISGNNKSWGSLESHADWSHYYKLIAQSNLVINKINLMSDDLFGDGKKGQLLGEAYFMRALVYFNIGRIWGHAPLITDPIESSDEVINDDKTLVELGRSTDIEIFEQVLSDVTLSFDLLDYGIPGTSGWGYRANKGNAGTLAGHANLWMAFLLEREGSNASSYIQDAVSYLEGVVMEGNYSLTDYNNPDAVKSMFTSASDEAVFSLNVSVDDGESYRVDHGGIARLTSKIVPLDGDPTKDRASAVNFVPFSKKQFIYPDFIDDKRSRLFFDVWESPYESAYSDVSQEATNRDSVTYLTKYSSMTIDANRNWNEYQAYFSEADIPVFRYSGVKLLLAEAYVKNSQPAMAIPIINEIRERAGLTPYTGSGSGSDILREVLQQRISELIGEGHIFYDMLRNNMFENVQAMTPARVAQQGYYWPVSSNVLISNKLISQTPYWNGKTTW